MKSSTEIIAPPNGNYRWTICALVFFATTINYLDRQVISLLKPTLDAEFGWSKTDYANITVAFQITYALAMFGAGRLVDRLGTKLGYAASLVFWSLAAMGHALVSSTGGFMIARAFLGVAESGNFPAAIKTMAEWFPKKERALATGIFNAGTNFGAIVAPLTVPFIAAAWGWRWAFIVTGAIGFIWLIFWWRLYSLPQHNRRIKASELDYIQSDEEVDASAGKGSPAGSIPWQKLLRFRQTWAYALGKFLTDGVWWFYLFWLPDFLKEQYGLVSTKMSLPIALVYIIAAAGSVFGGWLPIKFMERGLQVFSARRKAMLIFAAAAFPVVFAQLLAGQGLWWVIAAIGLAAAAHQAWSANIYTIVSDMFPKSTIASVTGIGGMAGGLGGILISKAAGYLFDWYKSIGQLHTGYQILFIYCGIAYLLAWVLMRLLVPRFRALEL